MSKIQRRQKHCLSAPAKGACHPPADESEAANCTSSARPLGICAVDIGELIFFLELQRVAIPRRELFELNPNAVLTSVGQGCNQLPDADRETCIFCVQVEVPFV